MCRKRQANRLDSRLRGNDEGWHENDEGGAGMTGEVPGHFAQDFTRKGLITETCPHVNEAAVNADRRQDIVWQVAEIADVEYR